jgi:hypothetical protein
LGKLLHGDTGAEDFDLLPDHPDGFRGGGYSVMERKLYVDGGDKCITFVNVQDVEPILDQNKERRSQDQNSDWRRHTHTIPNVVSLQWFYDEHAKGNTTLRMFSDEWYQLVEKKLADPDYFYLRVDKPKLQMGWK